MSLRQHLTDMMLLRPASYRALSEEIASRLRRTAVESVLKPGDRMPAFVLPDVEGNLVSSGDLLTRGPLIVVFFRGDWCPFCRATLEALNQIHPELTAAGARLVALTPDPAEHTYAMWRDLGLRFPVLSDVDSAVAMAFGTAYRVPDAMRQVYESGNLDLAARHGDGAWFLPMPATFIADRGGILRFAYASGDITDRLEPDDLVTRVRTIASAA